MSDTGAADGDSSDTSISEDGRFVAFASSATNLTSLPTSDRRQVFVRDMVTGVTQMVSVSSTGVAGGNRDSRDPSISADGRFVAFASEATDLDATLPLTDDHTQIYIRDLATGSTRLVTRNIAGTAGGRYNSYQPSLSGDGSRLVFASIAPDLLAGVSVGEGQVFTAELVAGAMTVVGIASIRDSGATSPGEPGDDYSRSPALSRDGSVVAFTSGARNLTTDAVPAASEQVFAHSFGSGRTRLVSLAAGGGGGDWDSRAASISDDGQRVAYESEAGNLVELPRKGQLQVYVRDLAATTSELVSMNKNDDAGTVGLARTASISGDGRRVAFASDARDLVGGDSRGQWQVYWRDLTARVTTMASSTLADPTRGGGVPGADQPSISGDGQRIAFTAAGDLLGGSGPAQVYLHGLNGSRVERVGGADRFAVSAAVSAANFPPGTEVVYVASGAVFSDALSGSAAAGAQGAPVLLVGKDAVPDSVANELRRLGPTSIVILGGFATISASVQTALSAFGATVSRIEGPDRFAVSAAVSRARFAKHTPTAYIASGEVFPDALSGSAAAGLLGGPVLLVTKNSIPGVVSNELKRLAPGSVVVLGGEATISAAVYSEIAKLSYPVRRVSGADRFEVSAGVAADVFPNGQRVVYVASGAVFPDALSGSASAIAGKGPVLLVTRDAVPASVAAQLERLDPYRIVVLGGPSTISDTILDALEKYLPR
ncbi:cell wall-binding repeat-containing protein [Herbiconiux liangxiaofengii]|uniref:cell wall-binding repeat-containing protein n=1 Tax=Herbiconiux liangxiaofengii TaxID=3342795 RepID=UPI0035B7B979